MKKKLLVAALVAGFAGFTGVAQADSVVLYGTLDGGLGFNTYTIKHDVHSGNSVNQETMFAGRGFAFETNTNQASKLGFKGDAFVFGQTYVFFKLETGLNLLNGASGKFNGDVSELFDRGAYFGFTSPAWGTFTAGYQDSASNGMHLLPFANFGIGKALPAGDLGDGFKPAGKFMGTVYGNAAGQMTSNIKYVTPRFLGFQLGASYDFNLFMSGKASDNGDVLTYHTSSYTPGFPGSGSTQHASAGLTFVMGPVSLAATYDLYRPIGVPYDYDLAGRATTPDKKAKVNEQSYSVGASIDIRGILVQGSWAQAFSDISADFGKSSPVGKTMASNMYSTFFNDTDANGNPAAATADWRNNAFSASITIPATEQGKFYFAYSGAITTATRHHFTSDDSGKTITNVAPDTKVRAFSQLWRAGYVQNISKFTSLYVYAGFGDLRFSEKAADQKGWKDANKVGTARLQQYGIGITHNF